MMFIRVAWILSCIIFIICLAEVYLKVEDLLNILKEKEQQILNIDQRLGNLEGIGIPALSESITGVYWLEDD